jgi:hypothetical protein
MSTGIPKGPRVDLRGQRFGRLLVQGYLPLVRKNWHCLCDCGKEIDIETNSLTSGNTKSCGCLNLDPTIKPSFKHGLYKTAEYAAFAAMKERCTSPSCASYEDYGGRGIKVCEEWLGEGGFQKFIAHIGMKPSPELSLDRINNDGNYEPGNVRWATHQQQVLNRRKDEGKPERSRQSTLNYWSRLTPEERSAEVKRRKFTTKKENTDEPCL